MSAKPMTKSKRKLDSWSDTAKLGRIAKRIADERGIPLIEAYALAIDEVEAEMEKGYER